MKSPRETDIVVDAPFDWTAFLPASRARLAAQDNTRLYAANATASDSPPNFFLDSQSIEFPANLINYLLVSSVRTWSANLR